MLARVRFSVLDDRLIAWGRRPGRPELAALGSRLKVPRLWLFTDSERLANPLPSARRMPPGRSGVIFRHDNAPERIALGKSLAQICRARRLALVVAGDARLALTLKAGMHLRNGRWPGPIRPRGLVTSSAHSFADLRRAARAGAHVAFLSPAFPTRSHPGASALGPVLWRTIARRIARQGLRVGALGGLNGSTVGRLGPTCEAAGAITAFAD